MKDRVVQYPHRYQLVPVAGESDTYDIIAKPGTITEAGTPINKATLLSDETAALYGLTGDDATVDNALKKALSLSSYMAFCGNVNSDMLDAAFGKGNEDRVVGLGRQLAMYAWFKGEDKVNFPFANLITKNTFAECLSSPEALLEILSNSHIVSLINASPYAKTLYNNTDIGKVVAYLAGLNPDNYADMTAIAASEIAMAAVIASETAMTVVAANKIAMTAIAASEIAMAAVIASETAMTVVAASITAMTAIFESETATATVIASSTAIDSIINSDVALYCISQNTTALSSLASSIENTTTILWESDLKWQTIYDTLNASALFTKSGLLTDTGGTKDRSGNLITLIDSAYSWDKYNLQMSITPAHTGCYARSYGYNWSTGKHIMWGGHTSTHEQSHATNCYVKHYMFTPIV